MVFIYNSASSRKKKTVDAITVRKPTTKKKNSECSEDEHFCINNMNAMPDKLKLNHLKPILLKLIEMQLADVKKCHKLFYRNK